MCRDCRKMSKFAAWEFPGNEGFSARNLWRMKQWYLFYNQSDTKLPQLGAEFKNVKLPQAGTEILLQPVREIEDEKLQQSVEEIPEFAGKLNFYVNAVDDLLKDKEDNPTIGLLICSDMNKAEVQWSFRGISTPIGVATYNNIRIKDALPTQEQLKERMELLQREMRATKRLMKENKKSKN